MAGHHRASRARTRVGLAAAIILAGAVSGCYTLLRHPAPATSASLQESDECLACHTAAEPLDVTVYPWVEYYSHSASPWINYYGSPWWHDYSWERCQECDGSETSPTDSSYVLQGRHGWGRRVRSNTATADELQRSRAGDALAPLPIISSPPAGVPVVPARPAAPATTEEPQEEEKEKSEPRNRGFRR
jgi:hypothetical protein